VVKDVRLLPTHKPDFVRGYHLSAMLITKHLFLPTLDGSSCEDRTSSSQTNPIHGISALKVYPHRSLLNGVVSSYLTFSPFSVFRQIVIFCGTVSYLIPEAAGYSPVSCSLLSGLSSPGCRGDSTVGSNLKSERNYCVMTSHTLFLAWLVI
jgi:hypothetical protein